MRIVAMVTFVLGWFALVVGIEFLLIDPQVYSLPLAILFAITNYFLLTILIGIAITIFSRKP